MAGERLGPGQENKSKWAPRLIWGGLIVATLGAVTGIGVAVELGVLGVGAGGVRWAWDKGTKTESH